MIFRHYRTWIRGLNPEAGRKVGRILGGCGGGNSPLAASPGVSPTPKVTAEMQRVRLLRRVEAGGIEPPSEGASPGASTSVADDLSLAAVAPIGRIARGQPAKISVPAPPASRGPSPRKWRLFRPYGRGPGKRGRLIRQPVRSLQI